MWEKQCTGMSVHLAHTCSMLFKICLRKCSSVTLFAREWGNLAQFLRKPCGMFLQCKICLGLLCLFLSFQKALALRRSSWINAPIYSMLSSVLDVENHVNIIHVENHPLSFFAPSWNVLKHTKTCVRDKHSFCNTASNHMPPWQISLIWISPLLHLTTWHVSKTSLIQTPVRSTATINLSVPLACPASSEWEKLQAQSC